MRSPTAERRTILHVIPTLTGGGAERQLALLAAEQSRRGCNVHIALRRTGSYARHLAGTGVTIHELGDLRRGHPLLFVRLHSLVRRLRPAVMQTWLLQMDIIGGAIALATRTPWVLTERCAKAAYDETPRESWIRVQLGRFARAIVANSNDGARYWRELLRADANIAVVPNAIDLSAVQAAPSRAHHLPERPFILSVGRLVPQKAPELPIRALALVEATLGLDLVMLGEGVLHETLRHEVERLGLADRVTILPYQADWWGLLKTATALINASRFEGQPNVVLEAMAARCPLIVSDIGPHRDLVTDASALLVPCDDPPALARAIMHVLADPTSTRARAELACSRLGRSTIGAATDAYEQVYAQIAPAR